MINVSHYFNIIKPYYLKTHTFQTDGSFLIRQHLFCLVMITAINLYY